MADALHAIVGAVPFEFTTGSTAYTQFALDGSNDRIGMVFEAPSAEPITGVLLPLTSVSAPTPTYKIGIQGVNGSGNPDGTFKGGGSEASTLFTVDAGEANTVKKIIFDNPYTPSAGELLCVPCVYSSGTIGVSNRILVTSRASGYSSVHPYVVDDTTGASWTKWTTTPAWGLVTASGYFGRCFHSFTNSATSAAGQRQALKMEVPSGWMANFSLAGFKIMPLITTTNSFKIGLWEGTTMLQEKVVAANAVGSTARMRDFYFDDPRVTLTSGTAYYLGIEQITTQTVGVYRTLCKSADAARSWPGDGMFTFATFNGTSWTDDPTTIPSIYPIFDSITSGGGGGGSSRSFIIGG